MLFALDQKELAAVLQAFGPWLVAPDPLKVQDALYCTEAPTIVAPEGMETLTAFAKMLIEFVWTVEKLLSATVADEDGDVTFPGFVHAGLLDVPGLTFDAAPGVTVTDERPASVDAY